MEPFKNFFNKELVEKIADAIIKVHKDFSKKEFIKNVFDGDWESKELKERMRHISVSLNKTFQLPYLDSLKILTKIGGNFNGWAVITFIDFVEVFGLDNYKESVEALGYFTQFSSSEFAVRPFIVKYPDKMMAQMLKWSKDKNHHLRRLSSEGCRPRLPWAMALPDFKKDPTPILPILENLKDDESEYVRKSVANNLNDISKDHPDLVLKIVNDWKGKSKNTDWILKHASRSLLKSGHTEALEVFGVSSKVKVDVTDFKIAKKKIKIGESNEFSFTVHSKEKKDTNLRLEYFVYYMKSNGKHSKKIFKISETKYSPGEKREITRKQSFADNSIRKHFPGEHKISIVCNGIEKASGTFVLNQ
ncbi:MAG: hypothetical protein A2068_01490 [Ignavibacteria bacterium GWB2_35_6b]|nr:MAG: hypothetical protein A2068_01490 [Ignavibacteria bacterium GWB2_35_6b]